MFSTFWSFTFWSLRMLHFSKCVICRMFILPIWWRFSQYIANLTPIQPTWSANDTALLSVNALQRSSASSYTGDFDAIFYITRYAINPYAHYVFYGPGAAHRILKKGSGPRPSGFTWQVTSARLAGDVIQVWINNSPSNHCISHFKLQFTQSFFIHLIYSGNQRPSGHWLPSGCLPDCIA